MKKLIILIVIAICFAIFNGLVINWKQNYKDKANYWREWWKSVGFMIRLLLPVMDFLIFGFNYLHLSILLFVLYPMYDIIIALLMGEKWYYQGTTSKINKLKPWMQYALKVVIFVNMLVSISYNLIFK